jgi:hypothetical protein
MPDCPTGKVSHASATAAWQSTRSRNKRSHRPGPGEIYRCPICHQWHVTKGDILIKQHKRKKAIS